jgi:hypothetical protein
MILITLRYHTGRQAYRQSNYSINWINIMEGYVWSILLYSGWV